MQSTKATMKNPEIDKVLIVGPNGNVGRALIPELLGCGYRVRALQYRSPVEEREGLEIVHGNTLDRGSVEKAMAGVDAVCHLIRATGPGDDAFEKWFNCCVAGAANLLEAARHVPIRRYIMGSADNVFGHTTIPHYAPINENSPKRFADEYYGLFKIVEEAMCRQYVLGFGVPAVIARFPLIWTEGVVERMLKESRISRRMDRQGRPLVRHDVHMDDVVQGILLCLQKDEAVGEDFIFCGPAAHSSDQVSDILAASSGKPVVDVSTDFYPWTLSCEKARSILGYEPRVNLLDWLRGRLAEQ